MEISPNGAARNSAGQRPVIRSSQQPALHVPALNKAGWLHGARRIEESDQCSARHPARQLTDSGSDR